MAAKRGILSRLFYFAIANVLVRAASLRRSEEEAPPEHPATAPYLTPVVSEAGAAVPAVELPPGWNRPQPEKLPRSTYWPSVLAFGIMLIVWGPITTWALTGTGVFISILALRGWIKELLRESEG